MNSLANLHVSESNGRQNLFFKIVPDIILFSAKMKTPRFIALAFQVRTREPIKNLGNTLVWCKVPTIYDG
jgi:hypothetical protein